MSEQEFGAIGNEQAELSGPSAWELIKFLVAKLPENKQEELAQDTALLKLVMAVKAETGENIRNLRKIEIAAKSSKAIEKLGKIVFPGLTKKELIRVWVLSSAKKDQTQTDQDVLN